MNIFVLDQSPELSAQYQCDKHVVKMCLETAQILCSVFYHNSTIESIPYKLTHSNHPCCIWARESTSNFEWLLNHFFALLNEYNARYGKTHKCFSVYSWIMDYKDSLEFDKIRMTPFTQAMPEKYKSSDVVQAYRNYYKGEKLGFAKWNYSSRPEWVK